MDVDKDDLSLADLLSTKEEEISKLRKSLKEKDEKLAQAGELGNQLLQQNAGLEEMMENIQRGHGKVVENYEQEKYSLKKKLEVLVKTGAQAEMDLQGETERWKTKLKVAEEYAGKKHTEELSQLKIRVDELSSELQQENLINAQRLETIELKENQIDKLQKELKQLQANLNDTLSSEVAELTNDNYNLMLRLHKVETNEHELSQMVQQLKEMAESSKKSEESMRQAKEDAERETSSYYSSLETVREECRELQAELDIIKLQPNDPKSRGNSLFAEVEDKRVQAEKKLISMIAQHKCMQSQNEQLKHYTLRLKMQISSLLETRSQGIDQEHIRSLEECLFAARSDNGKLIYKLKMLQDKLSKQRSDDQGPPPDAKMDGSAVIQFFKHELKDRNAEVERLTEELRLKEMYLIVEAKRVSGLRHELYERSRQLNTAKSQSFKLQVEIDRLRMKYGEDVKVRTYKHTYKAEKITIDSPQKAEESRPADTTEDKENKCCQHEEDQNLCVEAVVTESHEKQESAPHTSDDVALSDAALKSCNVATDTPTGEPSKFLRKPLAEITLAEGAADMESKHIPGQDVGPNGLVAKDGLNGPSDFSKPEEESQPSKPRTVKPRHSKIQIIDRSKITTAADCKQQ